MRLQITLYGEDARRFEEKKQEVAERRPGSEPSNPELIRVLLDEDEA